MMNEIRNRLNVMGFKAQDFAKTKSLCEDWAIHPTFTVPKSISNRVAIARGLQFTTEFQIKKLQVATDSTLMVTYIKNKKVPPWQCRNMASGNLAQDQKAGFFSIGHTYRETNKGPDFLADHLTHIGEITYTSDSAPHKLMAILDKDAAGTIFTRG
ncbi:hypothetical protein GIB67_011805 [Kingdonia uniflora]|uniref:RNase H type-1 domain-containing protein n=1 Tax=Kingdonia uniflora TaxID=39325 RepID=A0A7J7NYB4_9MAGN|nr:hypothetical protein GIB67_011805 [Kingdonia uniflora]